MTASAEPAVAMRFPISAWLSAVASKEVLCDCETEEREDIAESIDEVRGIVRWPNIVRSPVIDREDLTEDIGEDVAD